MADIATIQNTIRLQSEDLREELSDLARWEEEVKSKSHAGARSQLPVELPPIRGTAPLKPAQGAGQSKREDPVLVCKEQGNEYFRKGNFSEALRLYTKGIEMDPHSAAAHVLYGNRAMCHLKTSQWDQAERDATICVQMNRAYVKGFFRRAMARKQLKKWKEARSDLETVLVLVPGDDEAQDELAFVTEQLRQQEAEKTAAAGSGTQPKRKKLVIEEVDDDDDDCGANGSSGAADAAAAAAAVAERTRVEQERVAAENAAQEKKRLEQIAAEEAHRIKARKANPRVEIVEDDDDDQVKQPPTDRVTAKKPSVSHPKHVPARAVNIVRWTKDTLRLPKSFIDFEKTYSEIRESGDQELLDAYLLLIPPVSFKSLFGSSITSEIVVDLVNVALRREEARLGIMAGLSAVSRLSETVMFLSQSEAALINQVFSELKKAGHDVSKLEKLWN